MHNPLAGKQAAAYDCPNMRRRFSILLPMLLSVAALSAVLVIPEIGGVDEFVRYRVAESIVERGELSFPIIEGFDDPVITVYTNPASGKTYGLWNIGQSLVLVPFVAAGKAVQHMADSDPARGLLLGAVVNVGYAALINTLLALATYGVIRQLRLSRKRAALGVVALMLCTQWLVWGMSLQEESLCALLLMLALWCGLKGRLSSRPLPWAAAMGACFGFLANVRFNGAFSAAAVLVWIAFVIPNRKQAFAFVVTCVVSALPFLALLLWYNYARTGDAFFSPYQANFQLMRELGQDTGYRPSFVRFIHFLAGPDNGLLWFSLPALFLPMLRRKSHDPHRTMLGAGLLVLAILAHTALLCGFYAGVGVQGAGSPRYLAHQVILLGPLLFLAARRAWLWGARDSAKRGLKLAVISVFAASLAFQAAARLLNPELEHSQDGAHEVATGKSPQPYYYLPRRFANLKRAMAGELAAYSFPQGMQVSADTVERLEQAEARHTMLALPPAYFSLASRFTSNGAPEVPTLAYLYWWSAVAAFAGSAGWLLLPTLRKRTGSAPR